MSAYLITPNFHNNIADAVYNDILSGRGTYYYYLGKTIDWAGGVVPTPIPTLSEETAVRAGITYMSRINARDVCFVVPRINYTVGTVYDQYDGDVSVAHPSFSGATTLGDAKFYVLTENMNVYKCISNNQGQPSTVKPEGTNFGFIETADGYIWKFMYNIPDVLQYRFLTKQFMPVTRSVTSRYYSRQGIVSATVQNGGAGYEGSPVTTAGVDGDGSDATISLNINPSDGSIVSARITNPGIGYTTGSITIYDVLGTGTGAYGNPTAILTPIFIDGKLINVIVNDPGKNYSTDMQTNIVIQGTGTGAKLHPIVENGQIVDVVIESSGYGYSEAILEIESVTGTGAQISLSIDSENFEGIQSNVELLAIPGTVNEISITTPGFGYSNCTLTVTGDGTGLIVEPILGAGRLIKVKVLNHGRDYTWCNITVTGDGIGAAVRPLISPYAGHGFNALAELLAHTLCVYSTVKFDSSSKNFANDYRQFGIIRNPTLFGGIYREALASACFKVSLSGDMSLIGQDSILVLASDQTKKCLVIGVDSSGGAVIQTPIGVNIVPGETLIDPLNMSTIYSVNSVVPPNVDRLSGDIMFIDNRSSIIQTTEQFISLRTTFNF